MPSPLISQRQARIAAMHVLFAAITHNEPAANHAGRLPVLTPPTAATPAKSNRQNKLADNGTMQAILTTYDQQKENIEKQIAQASAYALTELTLLERAILAMATSEMIAQPLTPAPVIINEAVEITKKFGTDQGYRLVNGILNTIAKHLRQAASTS